jgi:DNA-directed RNA polymerase specialized sigma24 family protein
MQCFDKCLEGLSSERRFLIVEYYQQERRDKIDRRQKLAERLGIPQNALRIRAHRIRVALENCITECLEAAAGRNE